MVLLTLEYLADFSKLEKNLLFQQNNSESMLPVIKWELLSKI